MPIVGDMEKERLRCYGVLALADAAALSMAFVLANCLYLGVWNARHGLTMISVLIPMFAWASITSGSFGAQMLGDPRLGAMKAMRALVFAGAATLIIAYSFKVGELFSRGVFWSGMFISLVLILIERLAIGRLLLKQLGGVPLSTVVISDGIEWQDEMQSLVLDVRQLRFDPNTDDPIQLDRFSKLVARADRVVVACKDEKAAVWAHVLKCMAVEGEIVTSEVDRIGVIGVNRYGTKKTLVVSTGPLHLRDRIAKRLFDIIVSLTGLLILSPFMLATAIAIRCESPGPALFRQQRIGRDNRLFVMLKFRSMRDDSRDATGSVLTSRSDSRVTKIGNFIRRNSLDELPQLFNVIMGDMSIVGPRPHALAARAAEQLYWDIDDRYRYRHAVKPGVTGLAQIRGFRGATVSTADLTDRLSSDLEYLQNWSMSKDIWILFRTLFVIRHHNAF